MKVLAGRFNEMGLGGWYSFISVTNMLGLTLSFWTLFRRSLGNER